MKYLFKTLLILILLSLSSCHFFDERKLPPAEVKDLTKRDANIDAKINPTNQQESVLETLPLMNNAVSGLYNEALDSYNHDDFEVAIAQLERAYEIQPNVGQISQLMAEIYMHKGNFDQALYWSQLATKNAPSKGKSCEKSWRILALAAENLGMSTQQTQALENKEECIVKAGNRY